MLGGKGVSVVGMFFKGSSSEIVAEFLQGLRRVVWACIRVFYIRSFSCFLIWLVLRVHKPK